MDSQDYLDQISRDARPVKPKRGGIGGILGSMWFKLGLGVLVLLTAIMIFGSMLGNETTLEDRCTKLKLHIDRTTEVISKYQPMVKSSDLRSISGSLRGVLSNTSSQLNNYMLAVYKYNEGAPKNKPILLEADTNRDELLNELFKAKINGYLDRTFAHKMTNEIYLIMADEASIAKDSDNEDLRNLLKSSYDSLNNLYTQFNDFSEAK